MDSRYKYETKDLISSGAFGSVYKAFDTKLNRFVALKEIPLKQRAQNASELLKQEIETLKQVPAPQGPQDDFNYLITYHDYYKTEDHHHLVMELFEDSKDLQRFLIDCQSRLSPTHALEIFAQICRGVKALHTLNIVHRDLKPANFLIKTRPLRVKVVDFGYAKLVRNETELQQTVAGSPVYMSPQNIMSTGYDGKANDVWSLGIILHQMVMGDFPWKSRSPAELIQEITRYIYDRSVLKIKDMDFDVKDLVMDCLQLHEHERATIDQLLWKVESKLSRNVKTYDCNFRPLPLISWKTLETFRPKLQHLFLTQDGIEELVLQERTPKSAQVSITSLASAKQSRALSTLTTLETFEQMIKQLLSPEPCEKQELYFNFGYMMCRRVCKFFETLFDTKQDIQLIQKDKLTNFFEKMFEGIEEEQKSQSRRKFEYCLQKYELISKEKQWPIGQTIPVEIFKQNILIKQQSNKNAKILTLVKQLIDLFSDE